MPKKKKEILIGLLAALIIVVFFAPLASSSPDGLERVAEDHAFIEKALGQQVITAPLPGYEVPGLENNGFSGVVAGIIGIILTFSLMMAAAKFISVFKKNKQIS